MLGATPSGQLALQSHCRWCLAERGSSDVFLLGWLWHLFVAVFLFVLYQAMLLYFRLFVPADLVVLMEDYHGSVLWIEEPVVSQ